MQIAHRRTAPGEITIGGTGSCDIREQLETVESPRIKALAPNSVAGELFTDKFLPVEQQESLPSIRSLIFDSLEEPKTAKEDKILAPQRSLGSQRVMKKICSIHRNETFVRSYADVVASQSSEVNECFHKMLNMDSFSSNSLFEEQV